MQIDISDDLLKEILDLLCGGHSVRMTPDDWKEYIEEVLRETHEITQWTKKILSTFYLQEYS